LPLALSIINQALSTVAAAAGTPRFSKTRKGFMNVSRLFLLGALVLGLQAGLASALEPAAAPVNNSSGPALSLTATAAPADILAGSTPFLSSGLTPVPPEPGCPVESSCPTCCGACGQIIGGVGLYLVQPYFQNNLAYGVVVTPPRIGASGMADLVDIRQHMDATPLIWLGYLTEDGWGGRARYWYLREGTSQSLQDVSGIVESAAPLGLSVGFGNDSMTVTSKLEMQLLDLEGLADLRAGSWDFLFSTGLRLLRIDQTYDAYGMVALLSGHSFDGVGPTLCLETRRSIGSSGLAVYGSVRGSLVFGSADQEVNIPVQNTTTADHRDRGMPIGEIELGLEYDRQVGRVRLFGQIAFVAQDWVGAGSSSRSSTNIVPPPSGAFATSGVSVDSDIDLLGVCFRVGINY
jgi:hypothetical protein